MKKFLVLFLLSILMAGCTNHRKAVSDPTNTPDQVQITMPTAELTSNAEPTESLPDALLTYTLYLPNENADGFITRTIQTSTITADTLLAELQGGGALPADGLRINAFTSQGDQLNIDFNEPFADAVNAMGTSGEYMIVGSVVNTFLNAFQAQTICFTVNGETFESGHVIYDFPLTFFE